MTSVSVHRRISLLLKGILFIEALLAIWKGQWLTLALTLGIIVITLLPLFMARRFRVIISPEFELLAIGFVFASLFLGEVRGYYQRFWWWDIALHTASGLLLGIVGFLLVHVLNEMEELDLHLKTGFVAFFAFLFAVASGALWEIFEFAMDSFFGMNMQKPMLGDPSGLTDTMWDLIVDTLGAAIIAVLGYAHLNYGKGSFIERWIASFIASNPDLFKKRG